MKLVSNDPRFSRAEVTCRQVTRPAPDFAPRPCHGPAVTHELLRHIPHRSTVRLARIALEDVEPADHRIAAGEPVYVTCLAAHRDPNGDDPRTLPVTR
ncbi:hypothetical protein Scel_16300 [Streptomyces cellostaticus]|nr:hypothetical protein Scel_16300 [Streptomyces cellostaticus]